MKTVTVYNIKKAIEDANDGKHTSLIHELAIIEGPKGVIVSENDGVHHIKKSTTDHIPLAIYNNVKDVTHYIEMTVPLMVFIERCEKREVPLTEFIRTFGRRIEENYRLLLASIKEIGLDPADYPRKK